MVDLRPDAGRLYYSADDYNFHPDNIDQHTARLWAIQDGEIARDQKLLWPDIQTLLSGRLPKANPIKPVPSDLK